MLKPVKYIKLTKERFFIMETKKFLGNKLGIAVLGLVLLVGVAAGCNSSTSVDVDKSPDTDTAQNRTSDNNMTNNVNMIGTSSKAVDLRVALDDLFTEHVDLALTATRSGYDGRADFNAAAKSLDNNSINISKAVGSVYGAEAEANFLRIWRSHIGFFVDYTVASKKQDKAGQDKAVRDLGGYQQDFAQFFSDANPNLPKAAVLTAVTQHVTQLKGAVDAYTVADYTKAYALQNEARTHMSMTANTIAGAIVTQFPDKFK